MGTLFTCPHCNAVYFIDWNGQPELAQHEVEEEQPIENPQDIQAGTDFEGGASFEGGVAFEPPQQDFNTFGGAPDYSAPVEQEGYVGDIPQQVPEEMAPQEDPYLAPAEEIPPGSVIETPGEMSAEAGMEAYSTEEAPYDFSQTLDRVQEPTPAPASTPDTPDFSDVTDFANANTSAGPLTYSVIIDGIESSHLLLQLREAMTDSRFGWDVAELLSHVGGGRLVLKGLTPAKASVLINRIKYLPFKISWRQDVLSSS
ncbi:hypothetical protein QJS83_16610 [Bdellovibrio sp. 22V]|uniref:hypothetical protein n=1 Tax=Bdellovibrio sp. 22V TaxID=3044166 RepID=UPI002542CAEC|nr:hypothetical protein [Bdellovibrio sp. 22V]WII72085.1 hypothetical protein QJS83_16610 [Bdellovibrio sp. 22V]